MDTLLRILCCINARDVWLLLIRVSSNTLHGGSLLGLKRERLSLFGCVETWLHINYRQLSAYYVVFINARDVWLLLIRVSSNTLQSQQSRSDAADMLVSVLQEQMLVISTKNIKKHIIKLCEDFLKLLQTRDSRINESYDAKLLKIVQ